MNHDKPEYIVDTNVPIIANANQTPQAGLECVLACVDHLEQIQDAGILLLDDKYLIFQEYDTYLNPSGKPGPGDRFFNWLLLNQGDEQHCRIIPITPNPDREFNEFPNDPTLATFDRSDRKFVAVALAAQTAPQILNAADTDWWQHRAALQQHGITITFLCPELMQ